jgi:hypothetical protein
MIEENIMTNIPIKKTPEQTIEPVNPDKKVHISRRPKMIKKARLTRSLADFVKIVDILDDGGASFVSITQSFNTATSMGRLTLNMGDVERSDN